MSSERSFFTEISAMNFSSKSSSVVATRGLNGFHLSFIFIELRSILTDLSFVMFVCTGNSRKSSTFCCSFRNSRFLSSFLSLSLVFSNWFGVGLAFRLHGRCPGGNFKFVAQGFNVRLLLRKTFSRDTLSFLPMAHSFGDTRYCPVYLLYQIDFDLRRDIFSSGKKMEQLLETVFPGFYYDPNKKLYFNSDHLLFVCH